jgi:hypothetical protein
MRMSTEDGNSTRGIPEPTVDPPEPPRPDALDTWSPGLTDESGELPVRDAVIAEGDEAEIATEEPSG